MCVPVVFLYFRATKNHLNSSPVFSPGHQRNNKQIRVKLEEAMIGLYFPKKLGVTNSTIFFILVTLNSVIDIFFTLYALDLVLLIFFTY